MVDAAIFISTNFFFLFQCVDLCYGFESVFHDILGTIKP